MNDATITVNSAWLRSRVTELGLKQWWLAEQIGVDRKTVIRWLHGHVRQMQLGNATALAGVLGCAVAELELPRAVVELASVADQRAAAALLATSALLDKLGPVGEWDVIERLLKAVAVPDLPLHVLGTLYHRLSVACWRQDKLAEAQTYNDAALDAAQRCDDKALLAGVHASRANLLHWRGECLSAREQCRAGLALRPFIEPVAAAALHNNLGINLYELGEFDEGEHELLAACRLYRSDGTPMQRSINHAALAMLALRRGDLDAAERSADAAAADARLGDYASGLAMADLLAADVAAHRGRQTQALGLLATALAAIARRGTRYGMDREIEGRVLRLVGQASASQGALVDGLRLAAAFPVEQAWLQHELMLTCRVLGDETSARAAGVAAIELFGRLGGLRQAEAVRATLHMSPDVPRLPHRAALP